MVYVCEYVLHTCTSVADFEAPSYVHSFTSNCSVYFKLIGDTRLKNLKSFYLENGLTPRVHGNRCRVTKRTLSHDDNKNIVNNVLYFC